MILERWRVFLQTEQAWSPPYVPNYKFRHISLHILIGHRSLMNYDRPKSTDCRFCPTARRIGRVLFRVPNIYLPPPSNSRFLTAQSDPPLTEVAGNRPLSFPEQASPPLRRASQERLSSEKPAHARHGCHSVHSPRVTARLSFFRPGLSKQSELHSTGSPRPSSSQWLVICTTSASASNRFYFIRLHVNLFLLTLLPPRSLSYRKRNYLASLAPSLIHKNPLPFPSSKIPSFIFTFCSLFFCR